MELNNEKTDDENIDQLSSVLYRTNSTYEKYEKSNHNKKILVAALVCVVVVLIGLIVIVAVLCLHSDGSLGQTWRRLRGIEPEKESPASNDKVAIVANMKDPTDLELWLRYHIGYMGVARVYLCIEDETSIPFLKKEMKTYFQNNITVKHVPTNENKMKNNYVTLQQRQMMCMNWAVEKGLEDKMDWLFHIDDDELLYTKEENESLPEVIEALNAGFGELDALRVGNLEVIYNPDLASMDDVEKNNRACFTKSDRAMANVWNSYGNGKSGVRLKPGVASYGPHQWKSLEKGKEEWKELDLMRKFHWRPEAPLLVLHYESCPFSRWYQKYQRLKNMTDKEFKKIPFGFYKNSVKLARNNESGDKAKEFWKEHKCTALGNGHTMDVDIDWDAVLPNGKS